MPGVLPAIHGCNRCVALTFRCRTWKRTSKWRERRRWATARAESAAPRPCVCSAAAAWPTPSVSSCLRWSGRHIGYIYPYIYKYVYHIRNSAKLKRQSVLELPNLVCQSPKKQKIGTALPSNAHHAGVSRRQHPCIILGCGNLARKGVCSV